eukprot:530244_1
MIHHRHLWNKKYGFDIFPSKAIERSKKYLYKERWYRHEIESFLRDARYTFLERQEKHKYDGMIIAISGHGSSKNTIITSNTSDAYIYIPKLVGTYFCGRNLENVPRVLFIDCCRTGQYNSKVEDEKKEEIRRVPLCICGESLTKMKVNLCYYNGGVRCDGCRTKLDKVPLVWHCPKDKDSKHQNGYSLCSNCAFKNSNKQATIFRHNFMGGRRCICGVRLQEIKVDDIKCYKSNKVVCNGCHRRTADEKALIWHCPKDKEPQAHRGGYDLCSKCYSATKNTSDLLVTVYGNSPMGSVKENYNGGMFTQAVCKTMSDNDGTKALWKLTSNMNPSLSQLSNHEQIVFKEGSGSRMDKLLFIPGGDTNYDVILEFKVDDGDKKEQKRLNVVHTYEMGKLMSEYRKIKKELLQENKQFYDMKRNRSIPFYLVQMQYDKTALEAVPIPIKIVIKSTVDENWKDAMIRAYGRVNKACPGIYISEEDTEPKQSKTIYVVSTLERKASTTGGTHNMRLGTESTITLGKWTESRMNSSALHELLHALGVDHEHQRSDRNEFGITVNEVEIQKKVDRVVTNTGSIRAGENKRRQYSKMDAKHAHGITTYDPHSIMNYENCGAFHVDKSYQTGFWNNSPMNGVTRKAELSSIDRIGMNILWKPSITNYYNPQIKKANETSLYYCGRYGVMTGKIYPTRQLNNGVCRPKNGANCHACRVLKNDEIPKRNGNGKRVWQGETGYFYCGTKMKRKVKYTDGWCGPNNGHPCPSCLKLITSKTNISYY